MKTRFEWDPAKAERNLQKHGVSFDIAAQVFRDPFCVSEPDRVEDGEVRWQTIGVVGGMKLVLVAHTINEEDADGQAIEVIRLISARTANRKEKRRYEQETR